MATDAVSVAVDEARAGAGTPSERRATSFRGDIDGLRAVAIVLVVAYHALVPGFHGGFIGVDVFFVISGYLITRNLLSEVDRHATVALISFWGKRIRRLVPALALMIAGVLALTVLIVPSIDWSGVAQQARWAALYISNIVFARQATNYFGGNIQTSFFLHTWSLGVEEQFYIVWPLLFAGACLLARRRRELLRPVLVVGFGVTFVVSLALCVSLTRSGSTLAFYGLPARAWEFAAAGLLAALPLPRQLLRPVPQLLAAAAGIAVLLVAMVVLSDTTAYPGLWALLPVSATVLLIVAGSPRSAAVTTPQGPLSETSDRDVASTNPVSHALSAAPMQWMGRVSYSWYLWHWPFILLAVEWTGHDRVGVRVVAALVALGVAAVAFNLVENRVRFSAVLRSSKRRTYAMGAAVTVAVLLLTLGLDQASSHALDTKLNKALVAARHDEPHFACARNPTTPDGITYCEDGDLSATRSVLLVGDSHAGHWQYAFARAAKAAGYRLYVRWHPRCPAMDIPIGVPGNIHVVDSVCTKYRADSTKLIGELHPDGVVLSQSESINTPVVLAGPRTRESLTRLWTQAFEHELSSLEARGLGVGRIVGTPQLPSDPLECIAKHGSVGPCALPQKQAYSISAALMQAEATAADEVGGVASFDISHALCPNGSCPMQIDGRLVYIDQSHLDRPFTYLFVPQIETFLRQVVAAHR